MESKVSVALLVTLGTIWAGVTLAEPSSILALSPESTHELADLEDAFGRDPSDSELTRELAESYLELDRPSLAIAAISSAEEPVRDDPRVLHRLAQAYEASGRMQDALGTAQLALARCARALGTADSSAVTPPPSFDCSERTYAALDMHMNAVATMARWGVSEPDRDPRAATAYRLAVRSARIYNATASR